jgi:hypothetical protein
MPGAVAAGRVAMVFGRQMMAVRDMGVVVGLELVAFLMLT